MAIKKSQIYSSLWASCDALRGGMDASQYKNYILTLLFISSTHTSVVESHKRLMTLSALHFVFRFIP